MRTRREPRARPPHQTHPGCLDKLFADSSRRLRPGRLLSARTGTKKTKKKRGWRATPENGGVTFLRGAELPKEHARRSELIYDEPLISALICIRDQTTGTILRSAREAPAACAHVHKKSLLSTFLIQQTENKRGRLINTLTFSLLWH